MKKALIILTFFIPLLFGVGMVITNADSTKVWDEFSNVDVNKTWTITFNRAIDPQSVQNEVYILNGQQKVAVKTSVTNNKLKVTPVSKLAAGSKYTLVVTNNIEDLKGKAMNQKLEIPFTTAPATATTSYKKFTSEYDMIWNMPTDNYKNFHLIGSKNGVQVGGYETRIGTKVFDIKIGDARSTVKAKYGEPLKYIKKNNTNYTQNYVDKYGQETSGTYLIDDQYVTFFYDAHKNNIVRSVTWVDAKVEDTKPGFFAKPTTELRNGLEDAMVELINQARVAEGLNALIYTPAHNDIARKHSSSMAVNNYFSHVDLNNLRGGDRMKNGGLKFSWWGENLAYGQYSAIYAHEALMNSLGHRENILRSNFTHIFVGVDFNSKGQPYFTMNFYTK